MADVDYVRAVFWVILCEPQVARDTVLGIQDQPTEKEMRREERA